MRSFLSLSLGLPLALGSPILISSCASSGSATSSTDGTQASAGKPGAGGFSAFGGASGHAGASGSAAGGSPVGAGGKVSSNAGGTTAAGGTATAAGGTGGMTNNGGAAGSSSGGAPLATCASCVASTQCGAGNACVQIVSAQDSLCLPDCASTTCGAGSSCVPLSTAEGQPVQACVPATSCGSVSAGAGGSPTGTGGNTSAGGSPSGMCGALASPDTAAMCTSCTKFGKPCQTNGCYGGYWCNTMSGACQPAPAPSTCPGSTGAGGQAGSGMGAGGSSTGGTGTGFGGAPTGSVGPTGGKVSALHFAIVGDTRPATIDDTSNYPSSVATTIWKDIQAFSPRPLFGVSTGDYMFASTHNGQAGPQLDLYLGARAAFTNVVFPALGNHECTGATASECGQGNADGVTDNYTQFLSKMLAPLGQTLPYYAIEIDDVAGAWTSKFVFVAANAWSQAQATWLDATLAKPTTYTFVIRHESDTVTACPGVAPSLAIIEAHPYTLKIVGHTHTYEHFQKEKTVVVGNGGAPLASNINYGYGILSQRPDGVMAFYMYDYATNAEIDAWAVDKDGNPK